jgi:hypothetical protein
MHETNVIEGDVVQVVRPDGPVDVRVAWYAMSPKPGSDTQRWNICVEGEWFGRIYESDDAYHVVRADGRRAILTKAGVFRDVKGYTSAQVDVWLATKWLVG